PYVGVACVVILQGASGLCDAFYCLTLLLLRGLIAVRNCEIFSRSSKRFLFAANRVQVIRSGRLGKLLRFLIFQFLSESVLKACQLTRSLAWLTRAIGRLIESCREALQFVAASMLHP